VRKSRSFKRFGLILCLIATNLVFISPSNASITKVIDATILATPSCGLGTAPTSSKYAIRFIAGTTASLSQVAVSYGGDISSNAPTMKVYNDNAGLLGSEIGTLSYSSIQQIGAVYSITYTGNISVIANNAYWLEQNQASATVNASHCYENTTVISTNSWNLSAGNSGLWRWRLPSNPGFDYNHWSVDFFIGTVAPDTTAPIFTSASSFSAAENIATSATAATIRVSESATVTISSGTDAARFNVARSETNTAIIKFNVSPDFEAPADVGGNNVYEITLTATDAAANAGTQSITITVTDVVDTSSFNSLALAGSATTATFRSSVVITANVSVASKVTFRAKNVIISGCKNKSTTGSSPNIIATCSWRPSTRGAVVITATAVPTSAGISSSTATPVRVVVGNRVGAR
jgi:hypothetical protein